MNPIQHIISIPQILQTLEDQATGTINPELILITSKSLLDQNLISTNKHFNMSLSNDLIPNPWREGLHSDHLLNIFQDLCESFMTNVYIYNQAQLEQDVYRILNQYPDHYNALNIHKEPPLSLLQEPFTTQALCILNLLHSNQAEPLSKKFLSILSAIREYSTPYQTIENQYYRTYLLQQYKKNLPQNIILIQ